MEKAKYLAIVYNVRKGAVQNMGIEQSKHCQNHSRLLSKIEAFLQEIKTK